MSTVTFTNLKPTGQTAVSLLNTLICARAQAQGTSTIALDDSVNISSIDDDGTGLMGLNFTNSFTDVNFNAFFTPSETTNVFHGVGYDVATVRTAAEVTMASLNTSHVGADSARNDCIMVGGLA